MTKTVVTPSRIGDFSYFPGVSQTQEVVVVNDLPEKRTTEMIGDVRHEFSWRGDEITGVCSNDDWLSFYPTADDGGRSDH